MADNPFYPGYQPDPKYEPPSNLFPGYYPGKPVEKRPQPTNYINPIEYNFDDLLEEWNNFELSLTENIFPGYTGLPKWVEQRILDDFKQSFSIVVKPSDLAIESLDEFDTQTMPGAFGVSFGNPIDWVKDPKKTLTKVLNNWKSSALNWRDLDTRVRTELWHQIVSETPDFTVFGNANRAVMEKAMNAVTERSKGMGGRRGTPNPMSIRNSGVMGQMPKEIGAHKRQVITTSPTTGAQVLTEEGEKIDVFNFFANEAINFETNVQNPGGRDKAYDRMLEAGIGAVDIELQQPVFASVIGADRKMNKAFQTFSTKAETARAMGLTKDHYGAILQVSFSLNRKILEGEKKGKPPLLGKGFKKSLDNYIQYIDDTINNIDSSYGYSDPVSGVFVPGTLESINPKEAAKMRRFLAPYKKQLEKIKETTNQMLTKYDATEEKFNIDRIQANYYYNRLERITKGGLTGRGHSTGDIFSTGYVSALTRDLGNDLREGEMSEVLKALPNSYSSRLAAYLGRFDYERQVYAVDEFMDALESGNLLERYLWKKGRSFLTGRTPSYYASRVADGIYHRLGLKINKFSEDTFEYNKLNHLLGMRTDPDKPAGWVFGNNFNLNSKKVKSLQDTRYSHLVTDSRGNIVEIMGKGIYGGQHFKAVLELSNITSLMKVSGAWNRNAFHMLITKIGTIDPATGRVLDLSNPDFIRDLTRANGGNPLIFTGTKLDEISKNIKSFREWVTKNRKKFKGADLNEGAFWYSLVETLNARNTNPDTSLLSVERRYIGILEKLWSRLNTLQSQILKRFGKFIAPASFIKTIIAERISDLIPTLLASLSAGASGGALAPLAPIIKALGRALRPVIRTIVNKVVDFAGKLIEGVVKGDILKALEGIEEAGVKMVQSFTKIMGIPFIIVLLLGHRFTSTVMTTYSPVDPSRGSSYEGAHATWDDGERPPGILPLPPEPPPGSGGHPPPVEPGPYGTGENCNAVYPIEGGLNRGNYCYHWDGHRFQDVQVGDGHSIIAPFDGVSDHRVLEYGGQTIFFFPKEEISTDCPVVYFAHLMPNTIVEGTVTQGTQIALSDSTGVNAVGKPHVHWATSTNGWFEAWQTDLCVVQTALDWGDTCDPSHVSGGSYGGPPLCCNSRYPEQDGCMCALNQTGCDEYYPPWGVPIPPDLE